MTVVSVLTIAVISVLVLLVQVSAKTSDNPNALPYKRIIGGTKSIPHKWPWMVNLSFFNETSNKYQHRCGATLIDADWVVTAAHCVLFFPDQKYRVTLGDHYLKKKDKSETHHKVQFWHAHDRYFADRSYNYDIAILKISPRVVFTNEIQPVVLPRLYEQVPPGTECVSIGWGATIARTTERSPVLRHLTQQIVSHKNCSRLLLHYSNRFASMCVGSETSVNKTCMGDSGGPVVCPNENGKWILQGIVSFGDRYCEKGIYDVVGRVSSFVEWIAWKKSQPRRVIAKKHNIDFHYYCEEWNAKGYCKKPRFIKYYCEKTCKGISWTPYRK